MDGCEGEASMAFRRLDEVVEQALQLSPFDRLRLTQRVATTLEEVVDEEALLQRGATPDERIRLMDEAARIIREGMTDGEWAAMEQAMNG